jgi:hypothetical protein
LQFYLIQSVPGQQVQGYVCADISIMVTSNIKVSGVQIYSRDLFSVFFYKGVKHGQVRLLKVQVHHLAEVIAIDGKGDRQRKVFRPAEKRPEEQLPVMDAFLADDPQLEN